MFKKIAIIAILSIALVSCGGSRGVKAVATKDAEAVNVIENHYENEVDFETLSGRMRTVYRSEEKTQSITLSFRMEKDEAIWMSASVLGFPVAKAYITPSNVSYYEKVSKTYFDGDFSLLSKWLGTPLDFQKLQNLLTGQAIYDLREEPYEFTQSPRGYQFVPSEENQMKKMFLLNSNNYKAAAQQLAQEDENRSVTITYEDYQEFSGKLFPSAIKIVANEGGESTNIELTYRSIDFDQEVSFPFEIPSGYDEINVE